MTAKVMRNSSTPRATSEEVYRSPTASVNSLAMEAEMVVPGRQQRGADAVRVADHEGDGHGLAERAAQAQHDAADHAGAGIRHDHLPDDLPGRGAQAVAGLLQHVRNGLEHIAHHRRR